MTDAKAEFLRERLDEDDQVARACAGNGEWEARDIAIYGKELAPEVRDHMARHDPARIMREIEAKRARLALYERAAQRWADTPRHERPTPAGSERRITAALLEVVIQGDLQAYSNHPGFLREWAM